MSAMVPIRVKSLSRFSIRAPRTTLACCFIVVLLLAPGLARLQLTTDGLALVPEGSPAAAVDRETRELFGVHDQVIVVLRSEDPVGVLNPDSLARLVRLTRMLADLEGIGAARVQSLANEKSDRVRPGSLEFRPWLEPLPSQQADLVQLSEDLRDAGVYSGTLLSRESPPSMTACLVDVPRDLERAQFVSTLRGSLSSFDSGPDELLLVGAPIAESTLGHHILQDLARLVPLSLLCMFALFLMVFRRPAAALLPLLEVGMCLLATLGLMGWLGAPFYLTVAILPVVLTAVGVADELHLFMRFLDIEGEDHTTRVRRTMDEMSRPIVQTSLTTAMGFLSFALAPLAPVRVFGVFMAIGVLLCMLWSLAAVPALLVLLPARFWSGKARPLRARGLAAFLARSGKKAALATVALVLVASAGLARIEVQDSWISGFAEDSDFARATRTVDRDFGGAHLLRVRLDASGPELDGSLKRSSVRGNRVRVSADGAGHAEDLVGQRFAVDLLLGTNPPRLHETRILAAKIEGREVLLELEPLRRSFESSLSARHEAFPFVIDSKQRLLSKPSMQALEELEAFVASQSELGVGRALGLHEHLAAMNFMLRLRAPEQRRVPEPGPELDGVLGHYKKVRGERRLREILSPDGSNALLTVFLGHSNYRDTELLMSRIREFAAEKLEPQGIRISFAGDVAVSQSMIGGIVRTQILSLLGSLLGVWIVASWLFRSVRLGFACALPALCAIAVVLGYMGWTGQPLGVATSMFAATVIGIGVDYAIHLLHRARAHSDAIGSHWRETLEAAAPAICLDALAIGLAFGILGFSQVPANVRLGVTLAASLLVCALVTLVLLPPCLPDRSLPERNSTVR